jgi:hypothetical protein
MSATTPPIRTRTHPAEDAVRRYVDALRHDLEPDPLFRRRLRGTVMNRFVAEREGTAWPEPPRRHRMGALGRACLYGSLVTALSVSGVMAASDAAVPGDLLYPLKLSIEQTRAHVAPAHLQDELAVHVLAERIDELGRLAESGDLARATTLALSIGRTYEQLASTSAAADVDDERLQIHLSRLEAVLERVPDEARRAIERAMSVAPGLQPDAAERDLHGTDGARSSGNGAADGNGGRGTHPGDTETAVPERTPRPHRTGATDATAAPEPSASPRPSARPEPSARPDPSTRPDPSRRPEPAARPDPTRKPRPTGP